MQVIDEMILMKIFPFDRQRPSSHSLRFHNRFLFSDDALAIHDRELLAAAVYFQLPKLIKISEDHIGETLTPNNVIGTLNLAADLKSERLDFCCSEFIAAHQSDVLATNTLCRLHPDALRDLIGKSILPASSLLLASAAPNTKSTATSLAAADGASAVTAAVQADINDLSEEVKSDGVGCDKKMSKDFIPAARDIAITQILSP